MLEHQTQGIVTMPDNDGVALFNTSHPVGDCSFPDDINPGSVITTEMTKDEVKEWFSKRVWTGLRFERRAKEPSP